MVGDWYGVYAEPIPYDYGTSVVYTEGNVVVDGQVVGTEEEYYNQAAALASAEAAAGTDESQWMPLGVFAIVEKENDPQTALFQLSVSKEGAIRGSYAHTSAPDKTSPVKGSIDKTTQRVAWTIEAFPETIYECGLYNLTQDKVPLLAHVGKDKTSTGLLIRVNPPQGASAEAASPAAPAGQ